MRPHQKIQLSERVLNALCRLCLVTKNPDTRHFFTRSLHTALLHHQVGINLTFLLRRNIL